MMQQRAVNKPSVLDPVVIEFLQQPNVIKLFNEFKSSKQKPNKLAKKAVKKPSQK